MCTGSYLPISAALPQTPRTQAVTGPKAPYTIPWKQNFAKILLWLSLMKAIVPEETYSGLFYPRSFTMRGQNGTVKRAWDLETCNPEFESLPHCLIAQIVITYWGFTPCQAHVLSHLISTITLWNSCYHSSQFTKKKQRHKKGEGTCPKSHS